ncbi:peptidyl-prolyl cis-trans isomerase FKBP42-like [Zingiber officinale]|uniref:peptidyl-prolyl cis-trans isomerase FKBP42-like n=1 Tax=Zingiber officinale TaxID=94328 RepID=UPI001C4C879A|nr:peptidyl-prolyl cis-trans isomerase FKBP42-like [Zingiber officinale]
MASPAPASPPPPGSPAVADRGVPTSPGSDSDVDDDGIVTEAAAFVHNEPLQDDIDIPKVKSEVEILHENVKKQIIKEGHGAKPPKLSTCFCMYEM